MSVAENLVRVQRRVAQACARARRDPASVTLLAVSKLQPDALIQSAHQAGQRDFGENYAQELRDKARALGALGGLRWHAIGPLQLNKVKYVAKVAFAFHALDRLEVAQELSSRREGAPLRCYLQVKLGDEETKSGLEPSSVDALLDEVRALPRLEVVGLMGLPPQEDSSEEARPHFARLRTLAERLGLKELSMGTTSDFEVAIEEGATLVRVGTAIFGERP